MLMKIYHAAMAANMENRKYFPDYPQEGASGILPGRIAIATGGGTDGSRFPGIRRCG